MTIDSKYEFFENLIQHELGKISQQKNYNLIDGLTPGNSVIEKSRDNIIFSLADCFNTFGKKDIKSENINAVYFEFTEAYISPFIPTVCWIGEFSCLKYNNNEIQNKGIFHSSIGEFDLDLLRTLHDRLESDEGLSELKICDSLKFILIYKTFNLIIKAVDFLVQKKDDYKFLLPKPFYFFANRGHDENTELLLTIK